jgi:CBS domain-containing protein
MNCPSCGHENIDGIDRCENCLAPFRQLDVPSIDAAESFAQSVMEDNLGRLEYEPPVCVSPTARASEVTRQMKQAKTGCALVVDGGKLVGIFTEHDVLLRLTSGTGAVATGTTGVPPANEREARTAFHDELLVSQFAASEVPTEELRADEMEFEMEEPAPSARLSGNFDIPISALMSSNPETLDEKHSVAEALNRMSVGRYRHLPVRKSDGSYAVASIKSVLNYIAKEDW